MLSRCFLNFSVGIGAFVIGLSQISSFFSWIVSIKFGELWSPARQQLWPWRRSKVKVKVKVMAWCHLKGLVTRIMHAKYQCSIFNTSEDMSQVKVFVTDRRKDPYEKELYQNISDIYLKYIAHICKLYVFTMLVYVSYMYMLYICRIRSNIYVTYM